MTLSQDNTKVAATIIDLKNVCRYFDPYKYPHQLASVNWLEQQFSYPVLREFYQRFENRAIIADPLLKLNSTGIAVTDLQRLLNKKGANLVMDGQFGARTKAAVIEFQRTHDLVLDGVVGSATWIMLRGSADPHALRTTFYSYKPAENPAQPAALDWLQARISVPTLTNFADRWRNVVVKGAIDE